MESQGDPKITTTKSPHILTFNFAVMFLYILHTIHVQQSHKQSSRHDNLQDNLIGRENIFAGGNFQ